MPLPQINIRKLKDGRVVASFRDDAGRQVRTSTRVIGGGWTRAEQVKQLAEYGIELQKDQCAAGIGSDGSPMPPLKRPKRKFVSRQNGVVQFTSKSLRNLYGTGKENGHMLDAIRINYLDDRRATIYITDKQNRDKARGNERRAAWWGWSPASMTKLRQKSAEIFGTGVAEQLFQLGVIGASALAFATNKLKRVA